MKKQLIITLFFQREKTGIRLSTVPDSQNSCFFDFIQFCTTCFTLVYVSRCSCVFLHSLKPCRAGFFFGLVTTSNPSPSRVFGERNFVRVCNGNYAVRVSSKPLFKVIHDDISNRLYAGTFELRLSSEPC